MDVWPPDPQAEPLVLTALSPATPADAQTQISQLNTRLGQNLPAITDFERRITRWTPLAAFVLAAALTLAVALLGARVVVLGVLGCFVGSLLTAILVSDKHLYRYFKDR